MKTKKERIIEFLDELRKDYGDVPKFCHNLTSASSEKVYYAGAYFDENEIASAMETFLFGQWSSSGETCSKFERAFSKHVKLKHSFFTNSGSSANLLLVAACKEYYGWQDGDEIIVSAVGFPTTVSSIIQNGLKPVFADIEWQTLNFNQDEVRKKVGSKTKAIFLSPVLGNPTDIDYLLDICETADIKLLLDNCDSLGSKWGGKYLNEYAVASSCSFYPAHEMTTLEGGMVSSDIQEIVKLARSYATWGRDCYCVGKANLSSCGSCGNRFSNWLSDFPDIIIDHKYVFNRIGYNLKPLDLQAAMGLEQLKKLEWFCSTRQSNKDKIKQLFKTHTKTRTVEVYDQADWVPFGHPIICNNKEEKISLVSYFESNGIQTRNYFAGNLLMHPGYRHLDDFKKYPESNKVLDLVFFVGCAPTISEQNIEYIGKKLAQYEEHTMKAKS